jgi:hypothetical protein
VSSFCNTTGMQQSDEWNNEEYRYLLYACNILILYMHALCKALQIKHYNQHQIDCCMEGSTETCLWLYHQYHQKKPK